MGLRYSTVHELPLFTVHSDAHSVPKGGPPRARCALEHRFAQLPSAAIVTGLKSR